VKEYDACCPQRRFGLMMLGSARVQPDYSQSRVRQAEGTGADHLGRYGPPTEHNAESGRQSGAVWGPGRHEHFDIARRMRSRYADGID
jgi:hypothetical protein